ncbi:MAG: HAD-IA family hydrolase [Propionicimonas sp.]|nr:HAD-IA family hydrolase [Propionicimonas sp.]
MDTVIFDIGGVLIEWEPERAFEQVMPAEQVPAFMARIGFADWNHGNDARASIIDAEDDLVRRFPGDEVGIRAYRQNFLHTVTRMVPGTPAVLAELPGRGITVGALTNWAADSFALTRARFGVLGRCTDIVVSGEEGVIKPDPAIFRLACERLGTAPEQAVFIDDSARNVAAAAEVGLTGLHFTSAEQLRADLVDLGLLGERATVNQPVYHWALRSRWESALAESEYPWSSRETGYLAEGFVHCSFAHQLDGTRERFYADLPNADLTLLRIDPDPDLPILVEDGYPHLFAPLPLTATVVG